MSYKKYYIYKRRVSYDNGRTWQYTGEQTASGDPIGTYDTLEECQGLVPPTGGCDCSTFDCAGTGQNLPSGYTSQEFLVGTYTAATDCSKPLTFELNYGDGFLDMSSFRYENGNIYARLKSGNEGNRRMDTYTVRQGNCSDLIYVFQDAAPITPTTDGFYWKYPGHESTYSIVVDGNAEEAEIISFYSSYNLQLTNAVLSSDAGWIVTNSPSYVSGNELEPEKTNVIKLVKNPNEQSRTGTLTLTQKGTSNKITVVITQDSVEHDCTITKFNMPASICNGDQISFSFEVVDPECRDSKFFQFQDANGRAFNQTVKPSGGRGYGTFETEDAAVGVGSCSVIVNGVPTTYQTQIIQCTTDVNMKINVTNATNADVWFQYIDFYTDDTTLPIYLNGTEFTPYGGSTSFNVTIPADYRGESINQIKLRDLLYNVGAEYTCDFEGDCGTFEDDCEITVRILSRD